MHHPRPDLAAAWRQQSAHWDSGRAGYEVLVKVSDEAHLPLVLRVSGERVVGRSRHAAQLTELYGRAPVRTRTTFKRTPKKKAGRNGGRPERISSATQA